MGLLPELGLSEKLNYLATGSKPKDKTKLGFLNPDWSLAGPGNPGYDASHKQTTGTPSDNNPGGDTTQSTQKIIGPEPNPNSKGTDLSTKKSSGGGLSNSKLGQTAKNIKAKAEKSAAAEAIGRGWNDAKDYISTVSGDVEGMNDTQSKLGAAKDAMLGAYDRQYQKTKDAISGNRDLIQRNQKNDLRDLADTVRKSIFNSNISLGASANSSASEAAAKALSAAAGKNRQNILTGYGDKISTENQNEQNAGDTYQLNRKAAYDWEDRQKKDLIDKYNSEKSVIDRLKNQVPDWKKSDLDTESERNLQKLLSGLQTVATEAKGYRDYISQVLQQANDSALATDQASVNIDAPAALDTPEYTDKLSVPGANAADANAQDFYNPKVTGKKRYGTDIFGNPLTFDEASVA